MALRPPTTSELMAMMGVQAPQGSAVLATNTNNGSSARNFIVSENSFSAGYQTSPSPQDVEYLWNTYQGYVSRSSFQNNPPIHNILLAKMKITGLSRTIRLPDACSGVIVEKCPDSLPDNPEHYLNTTKLLHLAARTIFATKVSQEKGLKIQNRSYNTDLDIAERAIISVYKQLIAHYIEKDELDSAIKVAQEIKHTLQGKQAVVTIATKHLSKGSAKDAISVLGILPSTPYVTVDITNIIENLAAHTPIDQLCPLVTSLENEDAKNDLLQHLADIAVINGNADAALRYVEQFQKPHERDAQYTKLLKALILQGKVDTALGAVTRIEGTFGRDQLRVAAIDYYLSSSQVDLAKGVVSSIESSFGRDTEREKIIRHYGKSNNIAAAKEYLNSLESNFTRDTLKAYLFDLQ